VRRHGAAGLLGGGSVAASLLAHFLTGTGTGVNYRAGSPIAKKALASEAYSYGFPVGDTLDGFGPPMRYLQTVCGAPRHAGGAHWFPDTITVTVPFNRPA
jgi:hypothetical protein